MLNVIKEDTSRSQVSGRMPHGSCPPIDHLSGGCPPLGLSEAVAAKLHIRVQQSIFERNHTHRSQIQSLDCASALHRESAISMSYTLTFSQLVGEFVTDKELLGAQDPYVIFEAGGRKAHTKVNTEGPSI